MAVNYRDAFGAFVTELVAPMARNSVTHTIDPRSFDLKLANSVLGFWNAWNASLSGPKRKRVPIREIVTESFDWLPPALAARATLAGIAAPKWEGDTEEELIALSVVMFHLMCGNVGRGFHVINPQVPIADRIGWVEHTIPVSEWLNKLVEPLEIRSRLRYHDGRLEPIEVPQLTSVQLCAAYLIGLVLQDRWSLAGRIRKCPFERPTMHFFLDYRLDKHGDFLPGAQDYCCPKHSNAHRQQRSRDRAKARKHK